MKENFTPKLLTTILSLFLITSSQAALIDNFKQLFGLNDKSTEYKPQIPEILKDVPYEKWQDTESGRFAHSLQYEDKLAKPVSYQFTPNKDYIQEGIDYFEHLCATEGKDYIYKTAKDVDTVAQLRSFERPNGVNNKWDPQYYKFHPYALEAPLFFDEYKMGAYITAQRNENNYLNVFSTLRAFYAAGYINYQIKLNNGEIYNFERDYDKLVRMAPNTKGADKLVNSVEKLDKVSARYAFTWRGFTRPQDREYGIAGGDLIIIDLENNEIMAIQRTFMKANINVSSQTSLSWSGVGCFEQYKAYYSTRNLNFENKNFMEKSELVYYTSPNTSFIPDFLSKVLVSRKYEEGIKK